MTRIRWPLLIATLGLLSACESFGRGVTRAVLEQEERKDTRECHIEGPASKGLDVLLRELENEYREGGTRRQMKLLMVHGIGRHIPGYSGRLTEELMGALGLDLREMNFKEISLRDPNVSPDRLGQLRISRYMNKERTRELLFYELTWSEIAEAERQIIEFDDSDEHVFRRASVNASLKRFLNSHVPDLLVFLGEPQLAILTSVRQSLCWMAYGDWDAYADSADKTCTPFMGEPVKQLREDDFVIVTHSLGSRIAIDTLQYFANASRARDDAKSREVREILTKKEFRVYMLANQLPLLELGQKRAEVRGKTDSHCRPGGRHFDQRILGRLSIFAFSDPNDILSYPIPPQFTNQFLDSRLCASPTNVTINVATPISLFGFGEFAGPGEAHSGYSQDDRVISLIAHGIGYDDTAEIVKERCTWLETTDDGF